LVLVSSAAQVASVISAKCIASICLRLGLQLEGEDNQKIVFRKYRSKKLSTEVLVSYLVLHMEHLHMDQATALLVEVRGEVLRDILRQRRESFGA